eukprot:TRINITY_DN15978_c0_g1_i1.p1 TRINITY_DN15978_c0_g1~~TRINITY_DN15978_c0_g1_i1.p1  ORF type:complete len:246 (+),score=63.43 TRINITY_DN15978_c0_g1_i1:59-796(+)
MPQWQLLGRIADSLKSAGPPLARTGLIVLNTPLPAPVLRRYWSVSEVRIAADGGANRLAACDLKPDLIIGDLDSAEPAVLRQFREAGVEIRDLSEDQDTTDLDKALAALFQGGSRSAVVAGKYSGVDGRLDHFFGIVSSLFVAAEKWPDSEIVVASDEQLMCLLAPGQHELRTPQLVGAHCGLVPIAGTCRSITTTGLQWNMESSSMRFGGLVSVCNKVAADTVSVENSDPVLWMCSFDAPCAAL